MGIPTGGNLGSAHGSITINTTQAQQAPTVMAGVASGINRAMGNVNASVSKTEKGIGGLTGKFSELDSAIGGTFLVAGIAQLGRMTFELGKASAQADVTRESFDALAKGVGESSDALLTSMKEASRGTISENSLILNANRALISGAADSTQELTQILEIARATGRAFGVDTTDAYSRIVRAISKLEPELLDELGITLRLDTVNRAYAASLGMTADRLSEAQKRQALYNEIVRQSQPVVDAARANGDNAADSYDRFGAALDDGKKAAGDFFNTMQLPFWVEFFAANMKQAQKELQVWIDLATEAQKAWRSFTNALGISTPVTPQAGTAPWGTRGAPPGFTPTPVDPNADAIKKVKLDWAEGVEEINDDLHDDIIDAERSYGNQRANVINDYQKNTLREARDFATQRQRQEEDLLEGIADIHADAGRRELRMAQDLARNISRAQSDSAERIADAREDTNERLVELEEDYAKNRERAAADHRDKLLSLAGSLDAIGLLEERKKWARESKDAKEAHDDQRDDLKEQLAERIEDENKSLAKSIKQQQDAHDRQLADAREADRLRIEDMKADFVKRKAQEDADRAVRLQDMADDHADQLAEMDREHGLRLAQIHIHAQDERDQLDAEHKEEMVALGVRNDAWINELKRMEAARRRIYDETWGNTNRGHPSEADPYINRAMLPASSLAAPSATGASYHSSGVNIGTLAPSIIIGDAGGRSDQYIFDLVERGLISALEKVAGGN